MSSRQFTPLDRIIMGLDRALGAACGRPAHARRPNPGDGAGDGGMTGPERAHAAGLMRVNHAGEVAAQALYQAHALWAEEGRTRQAMEQAAREEEDHLAWCEARLSALGSHPSLLQPFWYAGSFAIGTVASLLGDRWGLGFVAETENQVVRHLDSHLGLLPESDAPSRAIVAQMRADELAHARMALASGGSPLPRPVRVLMSWVARIMTSTAYRI